MLNTPKEHNIRPDQSSTSQFQQSHLFLFNQPCPGPIWNAEHPIQPEFKESNFMKTKNLNQSSEIQSPSQFIQSAKLIDQSQNDVERFLQPKEVMQKQSVAAVIRKHTEKSTRKQMQEKMVPYLNLFDLYNTKTNKQKYLKIDDKLVLGWNIFFLAQMLLILVYSPLSKSFHLPDFNIIFIIFNCIEICLKLMTEFPKQGTMITDIRLICKYYLKTQITFDIIIIIALIINNMDTFINQLIIAFTIFPKINKSILSILLQTLFKISQFNIFTKKTKFIKRMVYLIISINFFVCLWHRSFVDDNNMSFREQYNWALFQVISIFSMNLDFNPKNEEQILTYCIIVISLISQLAFFFNSFHLLCSSDKQLYQLNAFFNKYKINMELKTLIINYFNDQQLIDEQIVSQIQHKQILNELHIQKRKLLLKTYFSNYSELLIERLVELSAEQQCSAGEIIVQKDKQDDQALYLILEGNVQVSCFDKQIEIIPQLGSFGEVAFFTGYPRNVTIQSNGPSTLLKIPRKLFLSLLTQKDREYYCQQRDIIIFNNIFPKTCSCCNEFSHEITNCPILTFQIDKTSIIEKVNRKFTQQRKYFNRRKRVRTNGRMFKNDGNFLKNEFQQLYWNQYQNNPHNQKQLFKNQNQEEIIEVNSINEYHSINEHQNDQYPSIGKYHKISSDAKSSEHNLSDYGKSDKSSIFVHQHQEMQYIEKQLRDMKDFEKCCNFEIYLIHNNFDEIKKIVNK